MRAAHRKLRLLLIGHSESVPQVFPQYSLESKTILLKIFFLFLIFFLFSRVSLKKKWAVGREKQPWIIQTQVIQLCCLCLTGFFLPAIISKSYGLLLLLLSWQMMYKRRRISCLLDSVSHKSWVPIRWHGKIPSCGRLFIPFFMHCCWYI